MTNSELLGRKLFELRKRNGLSQGELAEKLGVSRQAVSKWECGESLPDTDNLITISKLFDVSLDDLIGNSQKKIDLREKIEPDSEVDIEECKDFNQDTEPPSANSRKRMLRALYAIPYPIVVTVAFLLWGFLGNGWSVSWTLFITVPVYYSLLDCLWTKRLAPFAYPVFITFIYLLIGMQWRLWHPYWVLFITIPVFYSVAKAFDGK